MATDKRPAQKVTDRNAKSRTVEIKTPKARIKPDVEVNSRPDIMGDEGPVAKTNPHNKA